MNCQNVNESVIPKLGLYVFKRFFFGSRPVPVKRARHSWKSFFMALGSIQINPSSAPLKDPGLTTNKNPWWPGSREPSFPYPFIAMIFVGGTEGVKDEILLMASKELLKLPTWTRGDEI